MEDKISVIVPIYKVEQYLSKCIDSIIAQTYPNLEIILVDDGSPDKCGEICDAYAEKDSRICVIHRKNGGMSAARNDALDVATGNWIGFVDSDDWIFPDMYEKLLCIAKENSADIAQCGAAMDIKPRSTATHTVMRTYQNGQLLEATIIGDLHWTIWCNLYSAYLWDELRFPVGFVYEDVMVFPSIAERCRLLTQTSEQLYYYNRRNSGTVRSNKDMLKLHSKEAVFQIYDRYFVTHPQQEALGGLYMCKNIPAYRSIITANDEISPQVAEAHNKRMHILFCRYYPLAKKHPTYRKEPLKKRVLWCIYRIAPMCAIRLMKLARD